MAKFLPVRDSVTTLPYHRPPTAREVKQGYGATHWRWFATEDCCQPGTRIPRAWFKADDGLRYYYSGR